MFSWNSLFDLVSCAISVSKLKSFNPCFPGTRSSTTRLPQDLHDVVQFQSLFSWNSLFDDGAYCGGAETNRVSILVFLELALRPHGMVTLLRQSFCFNPCFPGTRSSTTGFISSEYFVTKFQSLFSWNSLFDMIVRDEDIEVITTFQSLFSWNSLFDLRCFALGLDVDGFNPCFPGTRSSTSEAGRIPRLRAPRFNPCFPGTRSSTSNVYAGPIGSREFQSLFSWNSLFDSRFRFSWLFRR